MADTNSPPLVLVAVAREDALTRELRSRGFTLIRAPTGALAVAWARDLRPDVVVLDAELPDLSAIDACRALHGGLRVGYHVPILMLAPAAPSPDERVRAFRAGAWDCVARGDLEALLLKVHTLVRAKRNIDVAVAEALVEPVGGLHNRPGLARRARELGALMARKHGALACVVFAVESEAVDAHAGSVVARAVRVCDVVGTLGQREIAVLAPGTDHAGALQLAVRIGGTFRTSVAALPVAAGYDAVANLTYSPIDPVELLTRAAAAVRSGTAEPAHRWVRRFDVARSSGPKGATPPPGVPVGPTSDPRRTEA